MSDTPVLTSRCGNHGGLGKRREQPTPIPGLVEDRSHLVATIAIAIQTPMLEFDARASIPFGNKTYLDFRLQLRVILPVGGEFPGAREPRVRLPSKHAAPVACTSIVAAFIPTAPHARFDHGIHSSGFADLVHRQRPPRSHLFCEDTPCHLARRLHANNLADAIWIGRTRHDPAPSS